MKPLVIIPTYNEAENLPVLLPALFDAAPEVSVLVVDDGSPDGTAGVATRLATQFPGKVSVMTRARKSGLASAYLAGFAWGMERGFDHFLEMDADYSHDPKYVPELLKQAADHDVVIGSRNIPGGAVEGWGFLRNFISKGGSMYSRLILGCPIRDLTGGFNLWSKGALKAIGLDKIISRGYSFQVEMKYRAFRKGLRIKEIPITFVDRRRGKSKMSRRIFVEALLNIWKLRFRKT
ncbi:MAG: polyprenol monophosphomannose synthase [Victivallales bacterium]|nr:polyprenol monophosphomannose synthase [Victivallales bacterium]